MAAKPKTIDEYLALLGAEQRAALQKLRKTIHAAAPEAEECISYSMPAFRQGRMLVGFAAAAKHCSFFLMSGNTVADHKVELAKYDTSKGTIRFPANKPLPAALVRKLVQARLAENAGQRGGAMPARQNNAAVVVAELKRMGSKKVRDGMARFAIPSDNAFGVSMADLRKLAKRLGSNHELAADLWKTGWYEARTLVAFVAEPERVTPAEMDRWQRDFDNWAICDSLCFHLFDKTPHAWRKVKAWSTHKGEFQKRAAFALLWGLTVHDKRSGDEPFAQSLALIERAADDDRNFVKKAVNMALRAIGKRNPALHAAAIAAARRLAASPNATGRWVGKDALRELNSPSVKRRIASRRVPTLPWRALGKDSLAQLRLQCPDP